MGERSDPVVVDTLGEHRMDMLGGDTCITEGRRDSRACILVDEYPVFHSVTRREPAQQARSRRALDPSSRVPLAVSRRPPSLQSGAGRRVTVQRIKGF